MASGDLAVEKEPAEQRAARRREYRTELEGESRRDLQLLAKEYCIPANIKSNKIIDEILRVEWDNGTPRCDDDADVPYQTRIETMEAVRSLMKRISEKSSMDCAADCIFNCVVKCEAEIALDAVKPAAQAVINKVPSGKEAIPSVSSCATAVKAVPVIGIAAKPVTNKHVGVKSEPAVVKAVQQVGVESIKPGTKSVGVKPVESVVVESKRDSEAAGFTSIFFRVSKTVTDDQLQAVVGINAKIGRRRRNRSGRIFVPDDDLGRVLKLESVSGHKLRVEKWRSSKAPSYHTNRHGRQAIKEDVTTTMKERARFAAEFLAQTRPERSYSQVVSNKVEARMKSMETAMYDVKQLLKRMSSREASTRATAIPRFHGGERV